MYEKEHIFPYSSVGIINTERPGNHMPTKKDINSKRGNDGLGIYYNEDNIEFTSGMSPIIPSVEEYNSIIVMKEKDGGMKGKDGGM